MMLALKSYQQKAVDTFRDFLKRARSEGAQSAFSKLRNLTYHAVAALPDMPYVCLHVPTGGGKTLLACHCIPVALNAFAQREDGVVLWLAPTNTIKQQTLSALRDYKHPYRQAIEASFPGGNVSVLDLTQASYATRARFDGGLVIIVSTFAALRVEDTKGRKIYEQNGYLLSHFENLPVAAAQGLECYADGKPIPSLANALRLRRPVLIIDEAHNARTPLSFDTLARLRPACALELTATPYRQEHPSNILFTVTATALKSEGMIKLPLELETSADWKGNLLRSINKRAELERIAKVEQERTGEYLRPLVLVQAEPKRSGVHTLDINVVREQLIDFGVPSEQIVIETGTISQLPDNLASPDCSVRYIITVDKLREGWDCPFAYVLCSVRDQRSRIAIEQILGRVLRLPSAKRKQHNELNCAYVFVTSQNFALAADTLCRAMEANGFQPQETRANIRQLPLDIGQDNLFSTSEVSPAPHDSLVIRPRFAVPQLAIRFFGAWEPFDESFLQSGSIHLDGHSAALSEDEFPSKRHVNRGTLDVDSGSRFHVYNTAFVQEIQQQLEHITDNDIQTVNALVVWLDRHIPHPGITLNTSQRFLRRVVGHLMSDRQFSLDQLTRMRLALRDAAAQKMRDAANEARRGSLQTCLFEQPPENIAVVPEVAFEFKPDSYAPTTLFPGTIPKHFYEVIGDLNHAESHCASYLATLEVVETWVRNLVRTPNSFWLPVSTGRFYPDFVAKLKDDRYAVIEYKGDHLLGKSEEKERIGKLWEERSGGKCSFLLVTADNYQSRLNSLH